MRIEIYPLTLIEAEWDEEKKFFSEETEERLERPRCLRCGRLLRPKLQQNAHSRYADIYICERCGVDEALRDASGSPLPFDAWYAVRYLRMKKVCYEKECWLTPNRPLSRTKDKLCSVTVEYYGKKGREMLWQGGSRKAERYAKEIVDFQQSLFKISCFRSLDAVRRFIRLFAGSDQESCSLWASTQDLVILVEVRSTGLKSIYFSKDDV